jgi:hypothetical protein
METAMAGAVTLLATFAKPSFAICLLPALCLIAAYRWWKKQEVNRRLLFFGFIVPTVVLLALQFLLAYGGPGQAGILLYPFGVMAGLSKFLAIKFLLSIVFPLVVALLFFQEARRDVPMVLAWSTFLVSAFYAYFLAEGAPRTLDGNFIWGAKTALLVLFSISTLFLFERIKAIRWKAILPALVWVLHVAYGVIYYYHILTTQKYI